MIRCMRVVASVLGVLTGLAVGNSALAQKAGGTLRVISPDSPATMSIMEEATSLAQGPMMGVFNNLVIFDQRVAQNRLDTIQPDLATSWSWNEDMTALTFQLRQETPVLGAAAQAAHDTRNEDARALRLLDDIVESGANGGPPFGGAHAGRERDQDTPSEPGLRAHARGQHADGLQVA